MSSDPSGNVGDGVIGHIYHSWGRTPTARINKGKRSLASRTVIDKWLTKYTLPEYSSPCPYLSCGICQTWS